MRMNRIAANKAVDIAGQVTYHKKHFESLSSAKYLS